MQVNIEVIRHRFSVTQGEAEVRVNGQKVVQYGDRITMEGQHDRGFGGYGSEVSDEQFIAAAFRQYSEDIVRLAQG